MEKEVRIIFSDLVIEKLEALLEALIENGYFSFQENAESYVNDLITFINSMPQQARYYPAKNNRFGAWYSKFRPNKHTIWFVIFDREDNTFLIKNIINNHTNDYPTFMDSLK